MFAVQPTKDQSAPLPNGAALAAPLTESKSAASAPTLSHHELIELGTTALTTGNQYFAKGLYRNAIRQYNLAIGNFIQVCTHLGKGGMELVGKNLAEANLRLADAYMLSGALPLAYSSYLQAFKGARRLELGFKRRIQTQVMALYDWGVRDPNLDYLVEKIIKTFPASSPAKTTPVAAGVSQGHIGAESIRAVLPHLFLPGPTAQPTASAPRAAAEPAPAASLPAVAGVGSTNSAFTRRG